MTVVGELAHVGSDLSQDRHRRRPIDPRDRVQKRDGVLEGAGDLLDPLLVVADHAVQELDLPHVLAKQEAVVVADSAQKSALEHRLFALEPSHGQVAESRGVGLSRHDPGEHRPGALPGDIGGHRGEFDIGVLQDLLDPVDRRRPLLDQLAPLTGEVPPLADPLGSLTCALTSEYNS